MLNFGIGSLLFSGRRSLSYGRRARARAGSPVLLAEERSNGPGFVLPVLAAAMGAWASPGLAQRQSAVGPGIIPLDATGILGGVDMSVSATTGTLTVGVPGGPQTDIFTLNNPVVAGQVAISTAASSQGNVVFNSSSNVYGAIGVTQPGGPFLRDISAGNAGTAVNFMGPVFATTLNVTGTGSVNFNSGNTNIVATNFAADGLITLGPNTTLIGALTTTAGANTGTLSMAGGSVLDGAVGGAVGLRSVNVTGGNNSAGVTATIAGAVNSYAFSLGTNTLNVGGALTIGTGGVVNTTLASPTVFGNIRPVGTTNLGPSLLVNVLVPPTTLLTVGTQFNIIQTQTGTVQSGTDGSVVNVTIQNPTNPLYTFAAVPPAGTVAGLVAIRTTGIPLLVPVDPPPGVVLPPVTPVAAVVVPVVLAPAVVASPDVVAVIAPINALSDPIAVVNAVTQLAPSAASLAAPLVTFNGTRQFQDLWRPRVDGNLCSIVGRSDEETASCRANDRRHGVWINGFGYSASQSQQQAFVGYNASIIGVMVGYDAALGPNTRAGVAFGFGQSSITGKVFDARTEFDSYVGTAYIGHERGPWYINGALSFGQHDYTSTRSISFPSVSRRARAEYGGQDYTAFATTGYNIPVGDFRVTPLASLQYTRVNIDGFSETGAGGVNLNVRSRSYDFLESGLGVKVSRPFRHGDLTFVPEVHGRWLRQLSNPTMSQTASFQVAGSPAFTTPGLRTADDTLNVGGGITLLSCNCTARTWSLEAVYDYYQRSDGYAAHQGMARLSARF